MDAKGYQQYKQQSISTMTSGELLLTLYDELIKRLMRAELALKAENYPLMEASVGRSLDIIHYLDDTLDRRYPISHSLSRLYEYFCYELARVKAGRNLEVLEEVRRQITELRDTFQIADRSATAAVSGGAR